ncbi:M48 family metalloprotease [Altererythrobacter sp. Root672]|uniref:M48 family metalloprotease n=1 Tax=Altererythrobacter sp. Root672 TaxID=1736584 RepID=UPI0006FF623D|nr:M48 family metalloprotease [Altererythrobacter sp. Root672]KRA83555.1 peptidase M48 Ste24p [Altererythrobacter sp. Root672]
MVLKFKTGFRRTALAGAAVIAVSASPVVAQRAGSAITPTEAQQGAQYHPELLREFGGEMTGPQADYVKQVGQNIAVQSGLSNSASAFNVTLLNSSVNNAFAIPGGYVYVTRQLVSLMNNEAELAGVLGHEVGHVAARHSKQRQDAAARNSVLGALGSILSGVLLGNNALGQLGQQVFSTAPQLLTLKYSRKQETEADRLGVQYLRSAGYDPHAMATVLQSLAAQGALDARLEGRDATMPEWASSHPDPASRAQGANSLAGNLTGVTNRDTFLTRIDGVLYGDDPHQGVVEGNTFIHPDLRLTFTVPQGYYMVNGSTEVSINGQGGQAQLTTAAFDGNLESYVRQAFQTIGGRTQLAPQNLQRSRINGLETLIGTSRVNASQGAVDVTVVAYQFANNQVLHFSSITPAGRASVFNPMYNSMRRISAQEAAQVIPRRIDVVTARNGDTVQSLANRMAYSNAQVERFRVLNGLSANAQVVPGEKYKIVIRSN